MNEDINVHFTNPIFKPCNFLNLGYYYHKNSHGK